MRSVARRNPRRAQRRILPRTLQCRLPIQPMIQSVIDVPNILLLLHFCFIKNIKSLMEEKTFFTFEERSICIEFYVFLCIKHDFVKVCSSAFDAMMWKGCDDVGSCCKHPTFLIVSARHQVQAQQIFDILLLVFHFSIMVKDLCNVPTSFYPES